jgi:hypothetical protein
MHAARLTLASTLALCAALAAPAHSQSSLTLPYSGDNQKSSVTQWMGPVKVSVDYSSPDVHGPGGEDRSGKIWGELVPYGLHDLGFNDCKQCPWRAGANENTVFRVSHDVKVEGQSLPAGAYGLFMIAGPEDWTVIFSKTSTSWGAFTYDPAEDALRVKVKPVKGEYREWLTYEFMERKPDSATVVLAWENLQVPIRITVPNMADLYVAQMKRELRNDDGFTWTNWVAAAQYCLLNNTHLEDGLYFAKRAIEFQGIGVANFQTLSMLAELQIANGMRAEAMKTIDQALAPRGGSVVQMHFFGRQLQIQGEKELALRIFQANAKQYPNTWPVDLGLARGYLDLGDRAKAMAHGKRAVAQAPDEPNRKYVENLLAQWESQAAKK